MGRDHGNLPALKDALGLENYKARRKELKQAMNVILAYERPLFAYLLAEIKNIPGIHVYGITNPEEFGERCPTLAFTKEGLTPQQIAADLGDPGIFVWDGNYYAISVTERLGLEDSGGMVRVGLTYYNTREEVDRLLNALKRIKP